MVVAPPAAQFSPSQRFTISIVGAVIGPGKYPSGAGWDPNGKSVPSAVWPVVQTKLGQGPTKVLEYITTEVLNSYAAPDPRGWAELIGGGKAADLRLELDPRSNTFVPNWTDKDWKKATIGPGTVVRVKLDDYDAFNKWNADDPIGIVDITSAQLLAAAKAGGVQYVDVSKATQMQLLYVQIAVRPE